MATVTPKALGQSQLPASPATATVYSPSGVTGVVRSITVCNTDAAARTFSLWKVPSGGSPADATAIFSALSIDGKQTIVDDAPRVVGAGGSLVGQADVGGKVTVTVDGAEVS